MMRAPGKLSNLEEVLREHPLDGHLRHRSYALGDTWAADQKRMRIRTATARAALWLYTTALSKTISS